MRRSLLGLFVLLATTALAAPAAQAFEITSFSAEVQEADGETFSEQAGEHPAFGVTAFTLAPQGDNVQNIRVDVPPGLILNPQAVPQCTDAQQDSLAGCPVETQIGTQDLTLSLLGLAVSLELPLYNMTFADDQVARFSFNPAQAAPILAQLGALHPVDVIGGVRWQFDYGLFFTISDVPTTGTLQAATLTFWGVPAAAANDADRSQICVAVANVLPRTCIGGGAGAGIPPQALLSNPTYCSGQPLLTTLTVQSYGGVSDTMTVPTPTNSQGGQGATGCNLVDFPTGLDVAPDTNQPDAPAGGTVNLSVDQAGLLDPDALAPSHLQALTLTLPPGMTLNPSAANGLEACTDAQLAQGTSNPVQCPAASSIGTVNVDTPLLPNPLVGNIYVAQQLPGDPYRVFVVANGHGVSLRLKGSVNANPTSGQLIASFPDNPQQPFNDFTVTLRGGPRAPLATPLQCGPLTTASVFTPYSGGAASTPSSTFQLNGSECGPPLFAPSLIASTDSPAAGAFSPFAVTIGRPDRNEFLSRATVQLPPGLLGMISSAAQCPTADAEAGNCPANSRLGTAIVDAGAGSEPFSISSPVYLTGPYKGAPFGLAVVVRAVAGPFDLGTVVARQAIRVNPDDASITVASDPLPTILEGVPLRLRRIVVQLDRPGFMTNPTSCGTKPVSSELRSTTGTGANPGASFTINGCEALPFKPSLSLRLKGKKQLKEGKHPSLRAVVKQTSGQARIRSARVALPLSLALDPDNANALCGFEAGLKAECPSKSRIGKAKALTPVLNQPLTGPVYFVQGIRIDAKTGARIRTLPTLLAKLSGEGVTINLRARSSVVRKKLVSTFPAVPDAPVSLFDMTLKGGKGGILVATRDICGRKQVANSRFRGHNGASTSGKETMTTPCGKKGGGKKGGRKKGGRKKGGKS